MGGFRAVEDRPTPKEVYNRRLYSECIIIATGSILFGYDSAFVGTTIARASFKRDFSITPDNADEISSNITSAFQAGAFFGALTCFFATERAGRRAALQLHVLVFIVGAILMTATSGSLGMIYAGRALTGLGCGGVTATVPSYIAELSVPSIRGVLTGLFEVAYQGGTVVGFWINYGISRNMGDVGSSTWRIPMAVQLVPAGAMFLGGFLLHESPLWLMRKGRAGDAAKALVELRRLPAEHPYVREDMAAMEGRLREEEALAASLTDTNMNTTPATNTRCSGGGGWALFRGAMREVVRPGMRGRVALVTCAFTLANLSGASAINYYSPTLFGSLGVSDVALYTGVYGLVKAAASVIFYALLIDVVGRRRPVVLSSFACSACLWFVGAYVKIGHPADLIEAGQEVPASTAQGGQAAIAMIMIYSVFWSFGLNGVPWVVSAEIFPGALRNFSGTYAALVQWLTQFAITKALPYMFSSFGYGTWFFFAAWMLIAGLWAYFFLPETKGLTIDQMDLIFGYNCERIGRIPHTSITTDLVKRSRAVAAADQSKIDVEHSETV